MSCFGLTGSVTRSFHKSESTYVIEACTSQPHPLASFNMSAWIRKICTCTHGCEFIHVCEEVEKERGRERERERDRASERARAQKSRRVMVSFGALNSDAKLQGQKITSNAHLVALP